MRVNKRFIFVVIFIFSAFAKAQQERPKCYFINAENGLNLREGPSQNHKVIDKLTYGAQVLVIEAESADSLEYVLDNGSKRYGNWVEVRPTFLYNYDYYRDRKTYLFDAFLTKHLTQYPEQSLHNFTELVALHAHDDIDPVMGVSSRREMYRTGQHCDVRYEYNPAAAIALKDIIQFEVVEKERFYK